MFDIFSAARFRAGTKKFLFSEKMLAFRKKMEYTYRERTGAAVPGFSGAPRRGHKKQAL